MIAALSACGGGGGSGAGSPASGSTGSGGSTTPVQTQPAASTPLQLTSSNATAATTLAFGDGALAVTMGQLAVDWTAQAEAGAALSFTRTCPGGGTLNGTLADRDGDRRASAGDQLTVTLAGCYVKELDDTLDGSVTVTLTAPSGSQQRAGIVGFSGFKNKDTSPNQEVQGALRFDYTASRLSKLVHVTSDTQPLILHFSDSAHASTETVTALDAQHETRVDTVRATTSMRFHVASELLGGSLDVTTGTPWSAWFDSYPDAGEIDLAGASGSSAALRARVGTYTSADVLMGGSVVGNVPLDGIGILWTGAPWLPQVAAADRYTVALPVAANAFQLLRQPDAAAFLPNGALTWLYSRPLDPNSVTGATFVQTGAEPGGPVNTTFTPVPAKVSIEGGLLTLTPSTQLLPGTPYRIQFAQNAVGTIVDTAGDRVDVPTFAGTVQQTVSASLTSGAAPILLGIKATLVLDGSASTASGAAPASFHWTQLSGPTLNFSDAGAARVTVSPAAGAANGTAVVALDVTNAAGDVDRRTVNVTVAADLTQALVFGVRIGAAPLAIGASFDAGASGYAHYLPQYNEFDILLSESSNPAFETQRFLAGLSGQTWHSGMTLSYGMNNTSGVIGPGYVGCASGNGTGTLSILDYALDASGNLDRLALDFDDNCNGAVTRGSIRYHSDVPLR